MGEWTLEGVERVHYSIILDKKKPQYKEESQKTTRRIGEILVLRGLQCGWIPEKLNQKNWGAQGPQKKVTKGENNELAVKGVNDKTGKVGPMKEGRGRRGSKNSERGKGRGGSTLEKQKCWTI